MENLKKLIIFGAMLATTYGAKAFEKGFEPARNGENRGIEQVNGQLMVKTENGKLGDMDMPYTFVGTNTTNFAESGFAVKEMADANSMLLDKDNNDVYFTRSSTNGVYKMTVSDRTALNGVGKVEFFESSEPVKVLSVKDGVIYTQNTNNNQIVELGNVAAAPESSITVPENLTNTLHSVGKDGIYVVTDSNIIRYNEDGEQVGLPKVHGIVGNGHTLKDVVAFDKDTIFILDTEGNLYHRSGSLFNNMTSVSDIARSKDGKSLLITSTNDNGKTVVSAYNTETNKTTKVYTEPADTKKPFAKQEVYANGIKYFVRDKSIGYE